MLEATFPSKKKIPAAVIGATSMIGSRFCELTRNEFDLIEADLGGMIPVDITNRDSIDNFFGSHNFEWLILFSAFTDVDAAELQKNDKNSSSWQINVEGTKNVAQSCKIRNKKLVYLSTDFVFDGKNGPYREEDKPARNSKEISWYGWTKSRAEQHVKGAVLRVAHPIKKSGIRVANDYVHATPALYRRGKLYPMFTDQRIQLTWIDDIAKAIEKLIKKPKQGIFHVTNPDWVTPYDLAQHIIGDKSIQKRSIDSLMRSSDIPLRFHKHNTLDVKKTQKLLGIRFKTWRQAVDLALTN